MRAATVVQVLQNLFYVLLHILFYLWSLLKRWKLSRGRRRLHGWQRRSIARKKHGRVLCAAFTLPVLSSHSVVAPKEFDLLFAEATSTYTASWGRQQRQPAAAVPWTPAWQRARTPRHWPPNQSRACLYASQVLVGSLSSRRRRQIGDVVVAERKRHAVS